MAVCACMSGLTPEGHPVCDFGEVVCLTQPLRLVDIVMKNDGIGERLSYLVTFQRQ